MTYNSFNSPLLIGLIILLHFCGVALSDTDILLKGPENGWYINGGPASSQIGSWFLYEDNLYSVCDTSATEREPTNWLRTDFIDVKDAIRVDIVVNYTVRKCQTGKKYCKEYFKLYGYQTEKTSPKPNPLVTSFDLLAQAKPTNIPVQKSGPGDFNLLNVSIKTTNKGLYLAFFDQGACLSLLRVLVSFHYCPEKGKNLVSFVRTVSPYSDAGANQVEGKCTDKHSRNTTALPAACTSEGNWKMNDSVRCLCQPGYEYVEEPEPGCKDCVSGKYKSEMSNTKCQSCPKNSIPDTKRTNCVCQEGFYKLKNSASSVPCEALPKGPSSANVTTVNSSTVQITWPAVKSNNKSFTYSIDCYLCKDEKDKECVEECGNNVVYYPAKDGFRTTSAMVSGLPSGGNFKFKVYVVTKINTAVNRRLWKYTGVYGKTKEGPKDPSDTEAQERQADKIKKLALTIGLPLIAFLVLIIIVCVVIMCRRSRKFSRVPNDYNESHELPTIGQKLYIDPTNYDNPEEALRNFAKELDKCSIALEKVIGGGEFGDVYKGILTRQGEEPIAVAVKTLKHGSSKKNRDDFLLEASVMGQFCDPNVVYLEGVVTKSHPLMIVTEFMSNGSLDNFLKEMDSKLSELQMLGMARGVASGMKFLSEMNFVHRDLAARNILVSESLVCKVADFGLSRELEDSAYETKGGKIPVRWTAPEAIKYRKFSASSDVWSYGILLWEIMSYAERPYWDWSNFEVMDRVEGGFRLPPPMHCPTAVHQIMLECWNADRAKRPKFAEIVKLLDVLIRSPEKMQENITIKPSKPNIDYTPVTTIDEWLNSIKMGQYTDQFVTAGYSNLKHLAEFEEPDLEDLGIKLIGHKNKIRKSIREVKTKLKRESSVPV